MQRVFFSKRPWSHPTPTAQQHLRWFSWGWNTGTLWKCELCIVFWPKCQVFISTKKDLLKWWAWMSLNLCGCHALLLFKVVTKMTNVLSVYYIRAVIWYVSNCRIFEYYLIFIYFQAAVSALLAVSVLYVDKPKNRPWLRAYDFFFLISSLCLLFLLNFFF